MATRFASQFARSAAPNLMRQFGDEITYFKRDGSPARVIEAMVIRDPMRIINETGDVNSKAFIVRVHNDSVTGIGSDEINTGGDQISVASRVGETAERRSIVQVLNDSAGLVRFLVQ